MLVDGNNIRNSFGYQEVGALQLTKKLESWCNCNAFRIGILEGGTTGQCGNSSSSALEALSLECKRDERRTRVLTNWNLSFKVSHTMIRKKDIR